MSSETWKVGDVAQRTGLSVRTLHHYDEIGLLVPSQRGSGGHRLYTARDLSRLERIQTLKSLGFALEEIKESLARPDFSPRALLRRKLDELRARIADEERLARRLAALEQRFEARDEATLDELIETLETLTMFEKYYTPEQLEQLKRRGEALGPEKLAAVQNEWPQLIATVKAEMERGTDPSDPKVRALAQRWDELVALFTGGDPGIETSLRSLYRGEPQLRAQNGIDPAISDFLKRARGGR